MTATTVCVVTSTLYLQIGHHKIRIKCEAYLSHFWADNGYLAIDIFPSAFAVALVSYRHRIKVVILSDHDLPLVMFGSFGLVYADNNVEFLYFAPLELRISWLFIFQQLSKK